MAFKKFFTAVAAASLFGGVALAADAGVKPGASVFDTQGGAVGTIEAVNGDLAVVSTGANKVSLPVSSFGQGENGPVIALTKAQLDQAASGAKASAEAELRAKIVPGASIYGSGGQVVGTVESVEGEFVTLAVGDQKAKLPISSVTAGPSGPMIAMSAADLRAAVAGSGTTAAATTETDTAAE